MTRQNQKKAFILLTAVIALSLSACTKKLTVSGVSGASNVGPTTVAAVLSCVSPTATYAAATSSTGANLAPVVSISFGASVSGVLVSNVNANQTRVAASLPTCSVVATSHQVGAIGVPSLTTAPQIISWTITDPSNAANSAACSAPVTVGAAPQVFINYDSSANIASNQGAGIASCTTAFTGGVTGSGPMLDAAVSQVGGLAKFTFRILDAKATAAGSQDIFGFDPGDGTALIYGSADPSALLNITHLYGPAGYYLPRLLVVDKEGMRSQLAILVKNYLVNSSPGVSTFNPPSFMPEGALLVHRGNANGQLDLASPINPSVRPATPTDIAAAGIDGTGGSHTVVWHIPTKTILVDLTSVFINFTGGIRPALADLNGDGNLDIIAAAGSGGSAKVRTFDGKTGQTILDNEVYGNPTTPFALGTFPGTLTTAAGLTYLLMGQGASNPASTGNIRFFTGLSPTRGYTYMPFGTIMDAVRIGSGRGEYLVTRGPTSDPNLFPYTFDGTVATQGTPIFGDTTTLGQQGLWPSISYRPDLPQAPGNLVVGTGVNFIGSRVRVYNRADSTILWNVQPWGPAEDGGARTATSVVEGIPVVLAAPGANPSALPVKVYNALTGAEITAYQFLPLGAAPAGTNIAGRNF